MEIKLDLEKEPAENLEILSKLIEAKRQKISSGKQRKITEFGERLDREYSNYMKRKYWHYIRQTIHAIGGENDTVVVDEKSLFQSFVKELKKDKINEADPMIFHQVLRDTSNKGFENFFIEQMEKGLYRITY